MVVRSPSPSIFRPSKCIDQSALEENKALVEDINRRNLLRGAVSLGALSFLTGCDVSDTSRGALDAAGGLGMERPRPGNSSSGPITWRRRSRKRRWSSRPASMPIIDIEDVKPVDAATWKLELAGRIADKRPWRAQQFDELPQQELIVRHICVEGWDYIGQWSGVNFRAFLDRIGADLTAKYIAFKCADDYTESLDMATALHPQTILATKYAQGAHHRSVRVSAASAHRDQAGIQESEVDHRDRGHQHFPEHVLVRTRLQLVQRD